MGREPKCATRTADAIWNAAELALHESVSNEDFFAEARDCCTLNLPGPTPWDTIEALESDNAALRAEVERLKQDSARLDWIQSQTGKNAALFPESWGWIARKSPTGRGYRLHETTQEGSSPTVRAAIDAALDTSPEPTE